MNTCWMVVHVVAHKPVNYASLTDSFITSFSKLLKRWSWMQTRQTKNSFPAPKSYRYFKGNGPQGQYLGSRNNWEKVYCDRWPCKPGHKCWKRASHSFCSDDHVVMTFPSPTENVKTVSSMDKHIAKGINTSMKQDIPPCVRLQIQRLKQSFAYPTFLVTSLSFLALLSFRRYVLKHCTFGGQSFCIIFRIGIQPFLAWKQIVQHSLTKN